RAALPSYRCHLNDMAVRVNCNYRDDPLSGKKTCSSELSASMRTCSRWQRMCSSSGISRLRLRGGSASKSRLPGHFDETFIPLKPRLVLVSSNRQGRTRVYYPSVQRDERHVR